MIFILSFFLHSNYKLLFYVYRLVMCISHRNWLIFSPYKIFSCQFFHLPKWIKKASLFSMQNEIKEKASPTTFSLAFRFLSIFLSIFIIYICNCVFPSFRFRFVDFWNAYAQCRLPTTATVHFSCDRSTIHGLNTWKHRKWARNKKKMREKKTERWKVHL